MLGVPQPSSSIGPNMNARGVTGKAVRSRLMMRGASATGSFGNRMSSSTPVRMPLVSASMLTPWWSPIMPPTPLSVNPKLSWIGANWP